VIADTDVATTTVLALLGSEMEMEMSMEEHDVFVSWRSSAWFRLQVQAAPSKVY
jgi:hypothetical protein